MTILFYPGVPASAKVMTDLLQHSLSHIDTQIEAQGEAAFDASGVYYYDLHEGLVLHIEATPAAIALLDLGRVGDTVETLIKYSVEQRRFCLIPMFEIEIGVEQRRLGLGKLWID